jgi:bifunctional ADP-heptose synthase (sugar kinase/adenylyltransferase)
VVRTIEALAGLKVLLVGEAIIDEYHYCQAIGKSSKEPTLVVRMLSEERFAGGILAVTNHVAGFADGVGVVTFLGARAPDEEFVRERLPRHVEKMFLRRPEGGTIVKRRFVESYFLTKLFEVYDFADVPMSDAESDALCRSLRESLPRYDVVVVFDYGHGMLTQPAIALLCGGARFLAVNTQSNAGNLGFHTISRYPKADYVCIAEHELRLDMRSREGDLRGLAEDVIRRLGCSRLVVTRGSRGALCYDRGQGFVDVPSFANKVVDRVGAGDAFLSVTALCAARDAPAELLGFVGNVVAADAVATVGHRTTTDRHALVERVGAVLG